MDAKFTLRLPSSFRDMLDRDAAEAGVSTSRFTLAILADFYGVEVPETSPAGRFTPETAVAAQEKSVAARKGK